jgi:hypothetical protein
MVFFCPTPAIGISLEVFRAPGSSGLKLGTGELPGEE